jgi:hypothetical protein
VFDRDDHASYFEALRAAESLDRKLKNDANQFIRFQAIASVPSFELWLLLHYEDICCGQVISDTTIGSRTAIFRS